MTPGPAAPFLKGRKPDYSHKAPGGGMIDKLPPPAPKERNHPN